jgi:hypothetical protein
MSEYDIEIQDPVSGNYVVVTAHLYADGEYEDNDDDTGRYAEIMSDPEFRDYTFEDLETGAIGIMPEAWKPMVDAILCNIYWDREFYR